MSPELARQVLERHGFRPGVDSTADPRFVEHRAELKAALNALRDDVHRPDAVPPPPALPGVKRPRRTEDVPPRGDRPGFVPPVHPPGQPEAAAQPRRRRRSKE